MTNACGTEVQHHYLSRCSLSYDTTMKHSELRNVWDSWSVTALEKMDGSKLKWLMNWWEPQCVDNGGVATTYLFTVFWMSDTVFDVALRLLIFWLMVWRQWTRINGVFRKNLLVEEGPFSDFNLTWYQSSCFRTIGNLEWKTKFYNEPV